MAKKEIKHYGDLPKKVLKLVKIFEIFALAKDDDNLMPTVLEFDNVSEFREYAAINNMVVQRLVDRKTGRSFLVGLTFNQYDGFYFENIHLAIPFNVTSFKPMIIFMEISSKELSRESDKLLSAYKNRSNLDWDEDEIQKFEDKIMNLFGIDKRTIEARRRRREQLRKKRR